MRRRWTVTVIIWVFGVWGGFAPGRAAESVLDNPARVDLDVWGGTPGDAISQIARQTGVMPIISAGITRNGAAPGKVYLLAKGLTLEQAVEWLAQALGCRYRVSPDGIYMTTGYEWVTHRRGGRRYGVFIRNVETLVDRSGRQMGRPEKIARFQRFLDEMMKVVTLFDPQTDQFRLPRLEEESVGIKAVASVPDELKPLFESALAGLEAPGLPVGVSGPQVLPAAARQLIERLSRATVIVSYRAQPLKKVIADLSAQAGLNIGFDASCLTPGAPLPLITLELGNVNVMEALTALARKLGLRSVSMSAPGGVWLGRARRDWQDLPSRRVLWADNVEARCYSLASLAPAVDGENLAWWVRSNVRPAVWLDPLASVLYHAPSNNLLVIAPAPVQAAVRAALPGAAKELQARQ